MRNSKTSLFSSFNNAFFRMPDYQKVYAWNSNQLNDFGDDLYNLTDDIYPDITVHLTLFNAMIQDGVPQKLEHNDIKWIIPAEEIPNYDFYPVDEEILNKLLKCKEYGEDHDR